jgi:hypothetical protein
VTDYDLRLLVNATADGWEGTWLPPGAGPTAPFPLKLPIGQISLIAPHLDTMAPDQIREELRTNLERFANASAEEGRNRSLLASLEFSKKRLSPAARGVLLPVRNAHPTGAKSGRDARVPRTFLPDAKRRSSSRRDGR